MHYFYLQISAEDLVIDTTDMSWKVYEALVVYKFLSFFTFENEDSHMTSHSRVPLPDIIIMCS